MSKKPGTIIALVIIFFGVPEITLQAQTVPAGKDMGVGFCSLHRRQYNGWTCPSCASASGQSSSNNSGSNSQLQLINAAVPLIMELFKQDPNKRRAMLEAQERELNKINAENEYQRQMKEALALSLHEKLMALYKMVPDADKLDAKSLSSGTTGLTFKTFDGDDGAYMYKGVDVDKPNETLDPTYNNTPFFGASLSPQDFQTLVDPENDPMVVDLRNANSYIEKNIADDHVKIKSLKLDEPKGNGQPIFQKPDCNKLHENLKGYSRNREMMKNTITMTQNELKQWEETNSKALNEAIMATVDLVAGRFLEHVKVRKESALNIKNWLERSERSMLNKGINVEAYKKMLDMDILNYKIAKSGLEIKEVGEFALFERNKIQAHAEEIAKGDAEVLKMLNDPKIKAFMNESNPGVDAQQFAAGKTMEVFLEGAVLKGWLQNSFLGKIPVVAYSQFAVDQTYNATEWLLSFKLILQQREVSGKEKVSAEYMQQKINDTFELLKDCK